MSCCSKTDSSEKRKNCPECGDVCIGVNLTTMRHHVQFPENQNIDNQNIAEGEYSFCPNPQCGVGYFSLSDTISKDKLRMFQRVSDGYETLLCYCFDVSQDGYLSALKAGEHEPIKHFVIQQTKLGACACEIRNPSGRCCLVNFKRLEKLAKLKGHP
ncbi:MAG: hypothetical protein R8M11_01545 [Gallionella sp.]